MGFVQLRLPLILEWDPRYTRLPNGTPFVRDQDYPCYVFEPGEPQGNCDTDGHYICAECKHLDPTSEYAERLRE